MDALAIQEEELKAKDGAETPPPASSPPEAAAAAAAAAVVRQEDGEGKEEEGAAAGGGLIPLDELRLDPTFHILNAQGCAAFVTRLDRERRLGAAATAAHGRVLRTTAELVEDVLGRGMIWPLSIATWVVVVRFRVWSDGGPPRPCAAARGTLLAHTNIHPSMHTPNPKQDHRARRPCRLVPSLGRPPFQRHAPGGDAAGQGGGVLWLSVGRRWPLRANGVLGPSSNKVCWPRLAPPPPT